MRVVHSEVEYTPACSKINVDDTVFSRRYTIFESILNKRYQKHGSDAHVRVIDLEMCIYMCRLAEAEQLQINVLLQIILFFLQTDNIAVSVVIGIFHHVDKLFECLLALVRIG